MTRKRRPDKNQLEQWYCQDKKAIPWIARECGVTYPAVRQWFKKFGIKARSHSEAQLIHNGTDFITKDLIETLYIRDQLSQSEIADKLGLSQSTIKNYLRRFSIQARNKSNPGDKNGMFGRKHSPEAIQKIREAHKRQFSDPKMRERYAHTTANQIAQGRTGKSYNKFENRIAAMFDIQGQPYIRQYRLGRYSFDFYFPDTNTLIEANGTFWHADPRFYDQTNLTKVQSHNVANDAKKAEYAIQHGYNIKIIWEADLPR